MFLYVNLIYCYNTNIGQLADEHEDSRYIQQAVAMEMDLSDDQSEPVRHPRSSRPKGLSLEESWTSLNLFEKSQIGRISSNFNDELQGMFWFKGGLHVTFV